MADDRVNLSGDDVDDDEEERKPSRGRRASGRRPSSRSSSRSSSSRTSKTSRDVPANLQQKLADGIARVGKIREHNDEELGTVIQEDSGKMAGVFMLLAEKGPPPAKVLVFFLAELLAPLDAFGRTISILLRRFRERQARLQVEWEQQQQEAGTFVPRPTIE